MTGKAMAPKTKFGRELFDRRRRARLSQSALARLSGVSPSLVNILERGEDYKTGKQLSPSVRTIRQLSDALAVDPFRSEDDAVVVNERLRDEIYEALFKAMQYDLPKVSLEDVRQKLISITGDPELVEDTLNGFERVPRVDPAEADAFKRALRMTLRGFTTQDHSMEPDFPHRSSVGVV